MVDHDTKAKGTNAISRTFIMLTILCLPSTGDNDPLDVADISSIQGVTGQIKQVKVRKHYKLLLIVKQCCLTIC